MLKKLQALDSCICRAPVPVREQESSQIGLYLFTSRKFRDSLSKLFCTSFILQPTVDRLCLQERSEYPAFCSSVFPNQQAYIYISSLITDFLSFLWGVSDLPQFWCTSFLIPTWCAFCIFPCLINLSYQSRLYRSSPEYLNSETLCDFPNYNLFLKHQLI